LDENESIPVELLDENAREWANKFSRKITTHQIRRFFNEVKRYQMKLERGDEFGHIKPLIYMLKSKASYAANKKPEMKTFARFMEKAIEEIKIGDENQQEKRFRNFCLFFEAVYGFADLKK